MKYGVVYNILLLAGILTFEKKARIICIVKRPPSLVVKWVKNPPASAGHTGSIPCPGRHHRARSRWCLCTPAPEVQSPRTTAGEQPRAPHPEKAHAHNRHSAAKDKTKPIN